MPKLMIKRVWGHNSPVADEIEFVFEDYQNRSFNMDKQDILDNIKVLQDSLVYFEEDFEEDDEGDIDFKEYRY